VGTQPVTTAPAAPVAPAPLAGARVETSFGIASVEPAVMASPTDPADDRRVGAKAPPAAERPAARPRKAVQPAKRKPAASKPATSKPAGRTVSKKAAPRHAADKAGLSTSADRKAAPQRRGKAVR